MLKNNIRNILNKEIFWDVTLKGNDNGEGVSTCKLILAASSPVFERMFYGTFQEHSLSVVELGFSSPVLRAIVWYLHTEEVDLQFFSNEDSSSNGTWVSVEKSPPIDTKKQENSDDLNKGTAEAISATEARFLVEFRASADYFGLPALAKVLTVELAKILAIVYPPITCAILDEAWNRGEAGSGPIWDVGSAMITCQSHSILLPAKLPSLGVVNLSPDVLKAIFEVVQEKYVLVQALQVWILQRDDETEICDSFQERQGFAVELATSIDLKELTAVQLSSIKPSKLFPMDKLFDALTDQVRLESLSPQKPTSGAFDSSPRHYAYVIMGSSNKGINGLYNCKGGGRKPKYTHAACDDEKYQIVLRNAYEKAHTLVLSSTNADDTNRRVFVNVYSFAWNAINSEIHSLKALPAISGVLKDEEDSPIVFCIATAIFNQF